MKRITHLSIVILALVFNSVAENYDPGQEYDAVLPGSGLHIKLYVPMNYTPDHR